MNDSPDAQVDVTPASPEQKRALAVARNKDERTARVMKWFTSEEKIKAIKASSVEVTIGQGAESRKVTIKPLTPLLFATTYTLLKQTLLPLMALYKPNEPAPEMPAILDALGDNVDKLPDLIEVMLRRGNNVSLDWIQNNFDLVLDLQLILPHFIEQNGLWHLFMGNVEAPSESGASAPASEATPAEATQTQD